MLKFRCLAILAMLALCIGCGADAKKEVETIAVDYMQAIFKKDTPKLMKMTYLPDQATQIVSKETMERVLEQMLKLIPDDAASKVTIKPVSATVDGDNAEVTLSVSGFGDSDQTKVKLVNKNGWKVVPTM